MLNYALICFLVGAVGGLVLAVSVFRNRLPSWALSLVHAALGAAGLVFTLMAVMNGAPAMARTALIVLVVAALGGFFLASFHLRGRPGPKPVVALHALLAVTGVGLLASVVLG